MRTIRLQMTTQAIHSSVSRSDQTPKNMQEAVKLAAYEEGIERVVEYHQAPGDFGGLSVTGEPGGPFDHSGMD